MRFFDQDRPELSRKSCRTASTFLLVFISTICVSQGTGHAHEERLFELEYVSSSPHPQTYFTQGLFFYQDRLYESIGKYGESALIKYQADNITPGIQRKLGDEYFAEGATNHQDNIYQLTWQAGKAFAYQGTMLTPVDGFGYEGEGWGLTSDGDSLWLSNGTDKLLRLDANGNKLGEISVHLNGNTVDRLNELEWINGWIFANRWYDTRIYIIDPATGEIVQSLDFTSLASRELRVDRNNVLNGIAWDPDSQLLWITGKNWQKFYQFKLHLPE